MPACHWYLLYFRVPNIWYRYLPHKNSRTKSPSKPFTPPKPTRHAGPRTPQRALNNALLRRANLLAHTQHRLSEEAHRRRQLQHLVLPTILPRPPPPQPLRLLRRISLHRAQGWDGRPAWDEKPFETTSPFGMKSPLGMRSQFDLTASVVSYLVYICEVT